MTRAFGACLFLALLVAATPPMPPTAPADLDLGPVPGPERLPEPEPFWTPLTIALVSAAGLAGLAGAWLLVRPRKPPAPIPPHQWALGEMDRLGAELQSARSSPRETVAAIADVLRRYLQLRFDIPAPDQTTAESMRAIGDCDEIETEQQDAIRAFLERTDVIKFTRTDAGPAEAGSLLASARFIVSGTAPAELPGSPASEPAERS